MGSFGETVLNIFVNYGKSFDDDRQANKEDEPLITIKKRCDLNNIIISH